MPPTAARMGSASYLVGTVANLVEDVVCVSVLSVGLHVEASPGAGSAGVSPSVVRASLGTMLSVAREVPGRE